MLNQILSGRKFFFQSFNFLVLTLGVLLFACQPAASPFGTTQSELALPNGFESVVVADSVGKARHIAVSDQGYIYVKLRRPYEGKYGNVALRDTTGDGRADEIKYFGTYSNHGGLATGMTIHDDYLYFSSELVLYRQKLQADHLVPDTPLDTVLIDDHPHGRHWHITKPVAFDDEGKMYVPFGSPSNACQDLSNSPGGKPGVSGLDPCPELVLHGGIWQFDANKMNQRQQDGIKYATGIRSVLGLRWNPDDRRLYAMMHGRDDLFMLFPNLYSRWQSAVLPAEELLRIEKDADYGWPYCYFDQMQNKLVLAPEYGGDGHITGRCEDCDPPLMGFPGHWAPNDLLFYHGDQFPERYRHGAFIAFHGSTNRAPYPQAGYFVCFVPFEHGEPTGTWEVFADGFAQIDTIVSTSNAKYRPMGLAEGPDGSLYITDSNRGKIWKISFKGDRQKFGKAELATMEERKSRPNLRTPDEVKDNLQLGKDQGLATNFNTFCSPCHQRDGLGAGGRFPALTDPSWVSDQQKLIDIVLNGLSGDIMVNGEAYNNIMPSFSYLDDETLAQILTYLRSSFGHNYPGVQAEDIGIKRKGLQ
ncbi:MAG: PQQ-dependent sugar dehydrogenase [Saprospiraceae bacterium]|nr:PQQ-dependent sugar dehydrogenase [Saprospiraceae bacterium]